MLKTSPNLSAESGNVTSWRHPFVYLFTYFLDNYQSFINWLVLYDNIITTGSRNPVDLKLTVYNGAQYTKVINNNACCKTEKKKEREVKIKTLLHTTM